MTTAGDFYSLIADYINKFARVLPEEVNVLTPGKDGITHQLLTS
jgi:hypothetical protein